MNIHINDIKNSEINIVYKNKDYILPIKYSISHGYYAEFFRKRIKIDEIGSHIIINEDKFL